MMNKRQILRAKVALAVGVLAVVAVIAVAWKMDVRALFERGTQFFREAGPGPFFAAMAVLPAVGFPLSPFTVAAGPVFGPVMGVGLVIVCAILAVTINAAVSYWLAASALRPLVVRVVHWLGYRLPEVQPRAAWPFILIVRIVPGPPFFLQSYLLGLARVPFGIYMVVSTLVPAAYIAAIVLFSDALIVGDTWAMVGAGAIFVAAGAVIHVLRKRFTPLATAPKPIEPPASS